MYHLSVLSDSGQPAPLNRYYTGTTNTYSRLSLLANKTSTIYI